MDSTANENILAIDIGGSHIKTILLDPSGRSLEERRRAVTPVPATPDAVIAVIKDFAAQTGSFGKVLQASRVLSATTLFKVHPISVRNCGREQI